jgi:hypothetical protein
MGVSLLDGIPSLIGIGHIKSERQNGVAKLLL